jgi:hypothetical protein
MTVAPGVNTPPGANVAPGTTDAPPGIVVTSGTGVGVGVTSVVERKQPVSARLSAASIIVKSKPFFIPFIVNPPLRPYFARSGRIYAIKRPSRLKNHGGFQLKRGLRKPEIAKNSRSCSRRVPGARPIPREKRRRDDEKMFGLSST